jgi:hypothetical protein
MYKDWYSFVEQYTTRKISYESDRIIAISGLANRLARELGADRYLNGLYLHDLARGILWTPDSQYQPMSRTTGLPSWSWASYPAAVLYDAIGTDDDGDEEERPKSMCSALASSTDTKLVLSGKCLMLRDLFPDEDVVPAAHEVDTGGTDCDAWKYWPDIRSEKVSTTKAVAFAVRTTAYEVSGLLLEEVCDASLIDTATYCRKGYFELSHEEGPSLFLLETEQEVVLV